MEIFKLDGKDAIFHSFFFRKQTNHAQKSPDQTNPVVELT